MHNKPPEMLQSILCPSQVAHQVL